MNRATARSYGKHDPDELLSDWIERARARSKPQLGREPLVVDRRQFDRRSHHHAESLHACVAVPQFRRLGPPELDQRQ